ncbi:hypothetical protein OAB91_00510 [Alphaproteobacteria bacterium]|nr:hypothetical protein [Alphaproteobacteria bacterium]
MTYNVVENKVCSPAKPFSISIFNLFIFGLGSVVNALAYLSLQPVFLALIFLAVGMAILTVTPARGFYERRIFVRSFSMYWLAAGVASVYVNILNDPAEFGFDAATFFHLTSSGEINNLSLIEIQGRYENAAPIILWNAFYNGLAAIGFERDHFVGILLNVFLVAFTGVLAIKMARLIYGEDPTRFRLLIFLFAYCGLFWLFAGTHVRDGLILLFVTALAYCWLFFINKPDIGLRLLLVMTTSLLGSAYMGYLRLEFVFVPFAMAAAGTVALIIGRKARQGRLVVYILVFAGFVTSLALLVSHGEALLQILSVGNELYSLEVHSSPDSLGHALIVSQATPVRLFLGSLYLFLFPIPFWVGFQTESSYHLFKSFNVLFFYFVIPLLVLSVRQLWREKNKTKPALFFILFLSLGFSIVLFVSFNP